MNRRQLETLLLTLESTPALLARAAADLSASQARRKPEGGGFSFAENVWHLADLEREGFGVRIRRILSETEPSLSNFDGERAAADRRYNERDVSEALAAFGTARARSVRKLRNAKGSDWKRRADQEHVGRVTLEDIARQMADHDAAHTQEVARLLGCLRDGKTLEPAQGSQVA